MAGKPKIFIDTNTLLSGLLFPRGNEHKILRLCYQGKVELMLSEYVIEEARRIFKRKFPGNLIKLRKFLIMVPHRLIKIPHGDELECYRGCIRDEKDLPILVSVIKARPDFFITGDKDFLKSEIAEKVNITKSKEFLSKIKGML